MTNDTHPGDDAVLARIGDAFGGEPRPEHFTDYRHCAECFEHDETLRARDLDTLSFDDIGNGAWDPITMTTPAAFAYLMPALTRLALAPLDPVWGWYAPQLAFQLRWDGARNVRWQAFRPAQRGAVVALIEHIVETRAALIEDYDCADEFLETLAMYADDGS